jgi:hypothetical protein
VTSVARKQVVSAVVDNVKDYDDPHEDPSTDHHLELGGMGVPDYDNPCAIGNVC